MLKNAEDDPKIFSLILTDLLSKEGIFAKTRHEYTFQYFITGQKGGIKPQYDSYDFLKI